MSEHDGEIAGSADPEAGADAAELATEAGLAQGGGDSVARNAAFAFASQMATAAFTGIVTVFLVRELGPSGYGVFALALGFASIALLPADFGITQSAARFIAERRGDTEAVADVLVNALRIKLALTSAFAVILVALADPIASLYDAPSLAWPLRGVAIALLGQSVMLLFSNAFVALGRISTSFRLILSESAIEATSIVVLVLIAGGAGSATAGRAVGYAFGGLIGALLALRLLGRRAFLRRRGAPPTRRLVRYAGALLVIDTSYAVYGQVDLLLVGALLGTSAAGVYGAPLKLTTFLHYPGLAAANAVAPRMARHPDHPPDLGSFSRALRYLIIFQAALLAPMIVWAQPIADLILGAGYEQSGEIIRALAPLVFLKGFAPLLSLSVNYVGEARRRMPIAVVLVLLSIVLTVIGIETIGIVGAAIGMDIAFSFYVGAHLLLCRQIIGLRLRPLVPTLVRAALAALAFAAVLFAFGTGELPLFAWIVGGVGGTLAFLTILIGSREIGFGELIGTARGLLRGFGRG
ncbi:MAG: oligosaccharide flippase family protein [Solirubrobacterales bacterium]